jgi:hypothetical protein
VASRESLLDSRKKSGTGLATVPTRYWAVKANRRVDESSNEIKRQKAARFLFGHAQVSSRPAMFGRQLI